MTDSNVHDRTPTDTPPAWRATLGRWWRAGQERTLVVRRRGTDHVRLPLNLVVVLTLVLAAWSWPVLVLGVLVAMLTKVEFVVQRDTTT